MIADQLKARFDIAPPKDPEDFFRVLASADATCRTSTVGTAIVVNFIDGSQLRSEAETAPFSLRSLPSDPPRIPHGRNRPRH